MTQDAINNYATDTDWTKEFMRTGISQQHNLALQEEKIFHFTHL
jgi:hypothetical protein